MHEKLISTLENFINDYYGIVSAHNAKRVISDFNHEWKIIANYPDNDTSYWYTRNNRHNFIDGFSKYSIALIILSAAYYKSATKEIDIIRLQKLIQEYEENNNPIWSPRPLRTIYLNIGITWHKLGISHYNKAVDAFKRYIYYQITDSSNTKYLTNAYAFRKCNTFLYQSLINDQLNLSSPTTFNDPFDCPILELLNDGTEISSLIRQAYKDCLKIACFTNNIKLPYNKDPKIWFSELVKNDKKHKEDKDEFLNSLMWAHYADSHRGVCIKYSFFDSISRLGCEDKNIVAYFKDVKYSDTDISKYTKNTINFDDAFFHKGKEWEYENELRFLYYNLNDHGEHRSIDIPNCIEAIYFGVKCSEEDKETIKNIMKNKELVKKDQNGNILGKEPIKFYQMKIDEKHFGQIKAVKI
ncbi:MAG: DUF2971 domain-containing protein [Bacteroidales bacterium]|nr:DUF2971 domain-containing protein [Bacteroidales bacterium]